MFPFCLTVIIFDNLSSAIDDLPESVKVKIFIDKHIVYLFDLLLVFCN